MKTFLDWSSYQDAGLGDAYADIPKTGGNFGKAVAVCINSKACEQRNDKAVMCPSFRVDGLSEHSTGGRVRLLKAALNGELGAEAFSDPELKQAMDLCVGCKGCKRECENNVDMALIKVEYLAQLHAQAGPTLRARLFARLPDWLHRGPWLRRLIRWRNSSATLARLGETLLGVAAARRLPEPAAKPFSMPLPASNAKAEGKEVVLWVDTFSRHFAPEIADAALEVLRAGGYAVIVAEPAAGQPPLCCGRTYLAQGMVEKAGGEARRMLDALLPHVDKGRPIVGLEPSCLSTLRDEYKAMGLGEGAEKLAEQALLFEEFIAREHAAKTLDLKFKPLSETVLVHGHCHQKALGAMKSMRKVLRLIPGLNFELIESSCCGMAGSFGLEAEHVEVATQMAELALLPKLRQSDDSLVLSNGFSCRHQIAETAHRPSLHLAQVLRMALA